MAEESSKGLKSTVESLLNFSTGDLVPSLGDQELYDAIGDLRDRLDAALTTYDSEQIANMNGLCVRRLRFDCSSKRVLPTLVKVFRGEEPTFEMIRPAFFPDGKFSDSLLLENLEQIDSEHAKRVLRGSVDQLTTPGNRICIAFKEFLQMNGIMTSGEEVLDFGMAS